MRQLLLYLVILFFCNISSNKIYANSIIIDDEILNLVHEVAAPIFKAANLAPNEVKIHIIDNNNINAFTAGGMSIFLNSGLLVKFKNPYILQGVIAHELGHILAGHISQRHIEIRNTQNKMLISTILGLVGSAIVGSSDLAVASTVGSSNYLHQKILAYSRKQETEADHIALELLYKANYDNRAIIELHKILATKHQIIPEYFLTHPVSESRIDHVNSFNKRISKPATYNVFSNKFLDHYYSAMVKLAAFTENSEHVLNANYRNEQDKLYAKAIAYYRLKYTKKSLEFIDKLISLDSTNPYYHELSGQIQLQAGNIKQSLMDFKKAHQLLPNSPVMSYQLGIAYIHLADSTNNHQYYKESIGILNKISHYEMLASDIFYYLAIAYGKLNEIGMARLSLAEKALLDGDTVRAKKYSLQAEKILSHKKNKYSNRAKQILKLLN